MGEENTYGRDIAPNKTAAVKPNFKGSGDKKISLTFKQNRSYELHVGKVVIRFEPKETKKVEQWVIDHKDFEQSAKYFMIKEI